MNPEQGDPEVFRKMFESFFNPVLQSAIAAVESQAGYRLPEDARQGFLSYHAYVASTPPPSFISTWRGDAKLEHWYHRHVNGVLGNVQNAVACAFYHRDRLLHIEEAVLSELEKHNYQEVLGNSTVGLGNTLKWDFEYQAFVLAVRRCLDYMTRALSAYFQDKSHSFRQWPKFLGHAKPKEVAEALLAIHLAHARRFDYVLSDHKGDAP